MKKVFLGGTENNSKWRKEIIPLLTKDESDFWLYVLTPKFSSLYSIAEAVDDVNKFPDKIIFCFLLTDKEKVFGKFQVKSLKAIGKMIVENGGKWFKNLYEIADYLNGN